MLVDTLHAQGIRVMLGANLNDPGYPTLLDAVQYGFAETGLTEAEAAQHIRKWSFDDFFAHRHEWNGWYDRGWVRMPDMNWDSMDAGCIQHFQRLGNILMTEGMIIFALSYERTEQDNHRHI